MPQRDGMARRYGYHLTRATPGAKYESEGYEREYEALMAAWRKANPAWDTRLTRGKELFDRHCASCHGDAGRGNGDAAEFLLVRPRDFTVAKYRYRSTPAGSMPLDGDLFRNIYRGLNGTAMPAWNNHERHRGRIEVESEEQHGTSFRIVLPAEPGQP